MMRRAASLLILVLSWLGPLSWTLAEQRFPPPDFESGYQLPATATPAARSLWFQYQDVFVLVVALAFSTYLVLKRRSRKAVLALSLFSLAYFGFYRQGCICAIGAVQNVALGIFDPGYRIPMPVLAFFLVPLVFALFAGRTFCASVCPHGALQDLVLLKPVKLPAWVEAGLGVVPFVYLGVAVLLAATGGAFLICRYDPFVPLFRLSGSVGLLLLGAAFLGVGLFVGRPYCRFLCPYGALLSLASRVSKWRVTITPDTCTQCRLCENSCPYGAIREPVPSGAAAPDRVEGRKRLGRLVLLVPVLLLAGGGLGWFLGPALSTLHPTVALGERYLVEQKSPVPHGVQTAPALALSRAEQDPKGLLAAGVQIRHSFKWGAAVLGAWVALVVGFKLVGLSLRHRRADYEPDRGACLACARCFAYCPSERVRCGFVTKASTEHVGAAGLVEDAKSV